MYSSSAEGEINAFVSNPQQMSLSIQRDNRWSYYLAGVISALFGGISIFCSLAWEQLTSYTFDKGSHRMYVKHQNVFKSEVREQMLHEIKEVRIIEETDNDGDKTYQTSLVLHSGKQIPIPLQIRSSEAPKVAQSINQFLNVKS